MRSRSAPDLCCWSNDTDSANQLGVQVTTTAVRRNTVTAAATRCAKTAVSSTTVSSAILPTMMTLPPKTPTLYANEPSPPYPLTIHTQKTPAAIYSLPMLLPWPRALGLTLPSQQSRLCYPYRPKNATLLQVLATAPLPFVPSDYCAPPAYIALPPVLPSHP